jgi:hypothetical protein
MTASQSPGNLFAWVNPEMSRANKAVGKASPIKSHQDVCQMVLSPARHLLALTGEVPLQQNHIYQPFDYTLGLKTEVT